MCNFATLFGEERSEKTEITKAFLFIFIMKDFFVRLGFIAMGLILVLGSCSRYEKLLRSDNFEAKYQKAMEYYKDGDVVKAGGLFETLIPVYKGTRRIDSITYYRAMCEYKQSSFILAGHYFNIMKETYPNSPFAEDAAFMNAFCYYKASPRPSLDQTNTYKAIERFQVFLAEYPDSDRGAEANRYLIKLRDKLVEKSFNAAKLYYDLEDYKAAIIALNNCLLEYPNSKYREDILFLTVKANFDLAENSVIKKKEERYGNTVDAYNIFSEEFPDSEYISKASEFKKEAVKHITN